MDGQRRWTRYVLIAAILLLAAKRDSVGEDGSTLMRRFREQYPSAAARLDEAYAKVRMRVLKREFDEDGALPKSVLQQEYARRNGMYRVITDFEVANSTVRHAGDRQVTVAHPSFSFRLVRPAGQDRFVTEEISDYAEIVDAITLSAKPMFAPTSWLDTKIVDLLSTEGFAIGSIAEETHEGRVLMRVEWDYPSPSFNQRGWFLFDPNRSWALHEYYAHRWNPERREPGGGFLRGVVTYDDTPDGIPLVRSFRQWVEFHNVANSNVIQGKPVQIEDYEVLDIALSAVGEEEFSPARFGLPSPGQITVPRSRWTLLLIVNGLVVALLAVAAFLRHLARRCTQKDKRP